MSKYNRIESIPISGLSEQELPIAIREWAEGNVHMESLLWACYNNGVETDGCHADAFPYISFYLDSKKEEILKLLSVAQNIKGTSFLVMPDGGNPFSGSGWNRPLLTLCFEAQEKREIDFILKKLTLALTSNQKELNTNNFFAQLLDLAHFFANKESGLDFCAFHNQDDSYSFIIRAEKTNFEYYNSLLQNAGLQLAETPEDWWCNEWSMEGNEAQSLSQKIKTCIASIMQNYSLEKPTEISKKMSFNAIARIKKREFGDSLEGQQKFAEWLQEEWTKRTNNLKKSYAIRQIFASGLQNAREMLHNASERFKKMLTGKDNSYER